MNVIFLEIEGVLTTARTSIAFNESKMRTLDPVAVRMIASICKQSDMKIVISSNWRIDAPVRADFVLDFCFNGGAPLVKYMLKGKNWRTPIFLDHRNRETEINTWLALHPTTNIKIVIDDETVGESLESYLVKTLPYEGFSFENYLQAIKIIEDKALLYGNTKAE
jgi:hypothetical protein